MPGGMKALSIRAGLLAGALAASGAWTAGGAGPLSAQEVVQPLPPAEARHLNTALRRLAQRPTDLDALLTAGNASLALHDGNAAAGFFARAATVAPSDPRVLLGQARVALEQRRPVEALTGFAQAERAGVRPADMAADRALAYDLVGDNAAAQEIYRSILANGDSAEVRRRFALSLAIAGNRPEFERTLYPLLRGEDRSAFRTRAFGLAILGMTDDAVEIADSMLSTDLALRMAPYLRYMPRLTKAQQAAAGNLGAFPAAAEIGRDSADIAGYAAAGARIAARADTSLTPSGAAFGPRVAAAPAPAPTTAASAVRRRSYDQAAARTTALPSGSATASAQPSVRPTVQAPVRRVAQAELPPVSSAPAPAPAPTPTRAPAPALASATIPSQTPAPAPSPIRPVVVAVSQPAPAPGPAPLRLPEPAEDRLSLAEAFADLGTPASAPAVAAAGAVDVARLAEARRAADAKAAKEEAARAAKAKREADAKAAKEKAEQRARAAEPARHWIQVGVGRNVSAFGFDWKKLAKQAGGTLDGKGPWAVKYGATNRMLAGPYATEAAARAALKTLKEKDIDALPFESAEGEKVAKAS